MCVCVIRHSHRTDSDGVSSIDDWSVLTSMSTRSNPSASSVPWSRASSPLRSAALEALAVDSRPSPWSSGSSAASVGDGGAGGDDRGPGSATVSPRWLEGESLADDDDEEGERTSERRDDEGGDLLLDAPRLL